ncbi:hypothetical protein KSS87_002389 [Heliosperma pusillum]|nr:hypothetical protein KSS87_002389 [Heliosperma pusillum]
MENSTSPRSIDSSSSSTTTSMRKCMSMNNLAQYEQQQQFRQRDTQNDSGYLSDDAVHASATHNRERKRGVPWTEEEHKLFLVGLNQVGKGDWRGISRNFVKTRSPTQVASHAQKYFLRRTNLNRRRRRSSLFDITADTMTRSASADQLHNLDTTFQPNQATNKLTLFSSPRPPTLQPISSKHARTVVSIPPSIKMAKLNLNETPVSSPTSSTSTNETREREFEPFLSLQIPQASSDDDSSRSSNFRGFNGNGDTIISVA